MVTIEHAKEHFSKPYVRAASAVIQSVGPDASHDLV
jgi:hypothetical protein